MTTKKNVIPFRTAYSPSVKTTFATTGESLTQQHYSADCNVLNIIRKYDKTGFLDHVNNKKAKYGDFTSVSTYPEAFDLIQKADQSFAELPSDIRNRFKNNAGYFLEFVSNPDNFDELVELGLAIKPKSPVSDSPVESEKAQEASSNPKNSKESSEPTHAST